ncbi:MAG: IS110 family transposase [Aigarchaeota archaeon]|nr:IS110 family transposase [Candidatus Pelearchaeum maunauluense]
MCKVPGLGEVSASVVIAEIGDPKRFKNDKQVASWSGLAPLTYQSVGKKQGLDTSQREETNGSEG